MTKREETPHCACMRNDRPFAADEKNNTKIFSIMRGCFAVTEDFIGAQSNIVSYFSETCATSTITAASDKSTAELSRFSCTAHES